MADPTKVHLCPIQVDLFRELFQARAIIEAHLNAAFRGAGIDPSLVVGGDVDGKEPHLLIAAKDV